MTKKCDCIEGLILSTTCQETGQHAEDITRHVAECPRCRAFQKAVRRDHDNLAAYADACAPIFARITNRMVTAIANRTNSPVHKATFWRSLMHNRVAQVSTAAIIVVSISVFLLIGTRTAWSQVVTALQDVQRIHLVITETRANGQKVHREEGWAEKPNRFRKEENGFITVDDGVNRLILDTAKKTAQLSESKLAANPREINDIFKSVAFFQQHEASDDGLDVKLTALPATENDETALAYAIELSSQSTDEPSDQTRIFTGKLWVAADTKLPLRLHGDLRVGLREEQMMSVECVFNYDPIPAEVFSTAVPNGYTELPRKIPGALRGKVVDEQGNPVPDAIVYATATYDITLQSKTDAQGNFELELLPKGGMPVSFPVFVAAYRPDAPDRVAWTVIQDPRNDKENEKFRRICPIPGDAGRCEVSTGGSSGHCGGSVGMVLKMEPSTRIHGIVTDVDGKPVAGAQVNAYLMCSMYGDYGTVALSGEGIHPRCATSTATALAVTDDGGRYELTNVPRFWDGVEFYMNVDANGFVKKSASFTMHGQAAPKEMSVQMYRAEGTVRGRAANDRGEPLMGYRVCPVLDGVEYRSVSASTGKDGRFTLFGCPLAPGLSVRLLCDNPMNAGKNWPKGREFVYYPPVEAAIAYKQGQAKYEVNLTAETPNDTLTVTLKDTKGRPVTYFPVELRTGIFHAEDWMNKRGRKRTDSQGMCVFEQVPHTKGMELYLGQTSNPGFPFPESMAQEEREKIDNVENRKYHPVMAPVTVVPEQNAQNVTVTLRTWDEWNAQKGAP